MYQLSELQFGSLVFFPLSGEIICFINFMLIHTQPVTLGLPMAETNTLWVLKTELGRQSLLLRVFQLHLHQKNMKAVWARMDWAAPNLNGYVIQAWKASSCLLLEMNKWLTKRETLTLVAACALKAGLPPRSLSDSLRLFLGTAHGPPQWTPLVAPTF